MTGLEVLRFLENLQPSELCREVKIRFGPYPSPDYDLLDISDEDPDYLDFRVYVEPASEN